MTAKQLTDSILQMAIQGKLVPQDPNDEPASVLLERIREKKRRLVAEGKLKANDIVEKPIEEQDIPYITPQGWEWIRLNFVSSIARGGSPRPIKEYITDAPNGVNWIKISDTEKGGKYIYKTKEKIKPEGVSRSRFVHKDNFLLTNSMSFGRPYILKTEGCIHDGWLVISLEKDSYDQDFMYYLLSSAFAKKSFSDKAAGAVVKNLNIDKVAESIFPLPPLSEQRRIVEKIEEYLPIIKEYGEAYEEASRMDAELPDKLKKSILQEAIMGKLGTQDPSDAPASCLLENIRAEKQKLVEEGVLKKKDLVETPVEDDEVPFNIPDTWEWGRLGDFFTIGSGLSYKKEDLQITSDNKVRVLRGGNISFGDWCQKPDDIFIAKKFVADELLLKEWTFITPAVSSLEHMGKTALIRESYDNIVVGGFILMLFPVYKSRPFLEYLNFLFQSYYYRQLCQSLTNKSGQAFYNLSRTKLLNAVIPIPPVDEQIRIVKKVEELFGEIDNMTVENNININEIEVTDNE